MYLAPMCMASYATWEAGSTKGARVQVTGQLKDAFTQSVSSRGVVGVVR